MCNKALLIINTVSSIALYIRKHSSTLSTAGSQDGHPQAGTQCHLHRGHGQGHHGGPLRGGDQAGRMVQKFVNNMCLSMVVVTNTTAMHIGPF